MRKPRDQTPGVHHVWTHAIDDCTFAPERCCEKLLALAGGAVRELGWRCLAWCVMPNHNHFLFETQTPTLARGMWLVNSGFAHWYNGHTGGRGHALSARYGSKRIVDPEQLLRVVPYVMANATLHGFCDWPGEWRWSSFNASVGTARRPPLLALPRLAQVLGTTSAGLPSVVRTLVLSRLQD